MQKCDVCKDGLLPAPSDDELTEMQRIYMTPRRVEIDGEDMQRCWKCDGEGEIEEILNDRR